MKKAKSKDIIFEADIKVSSSRVSSSIMKYLDVLIAFFAVYGATYVFISSYKIEVNNSLILGAIICSVLLFSIIYKNRKFMKYTLIGTLITYIISFYIFYNSINYGFMATFKKVIDTINNNNNYNFEFPSEINNYMYSNELAITIFFIFAIFLISALICYSIIYKPNLILLLLVTIPLLDIGVYFEIMPSYLSFELLVISWVAVLGMRTIKNRNKVKKSSLQFKRRRNKNTYFVVGNKRSITTNVGVVMVLITAVIVIVTSIIYPSSTYKTPNEILEAKLKLESYYNEFTMEKFVNDLMGVGQGGVNGGKLGTFDKIKYKHETALEITAPWVGNNIYLKGYTGCVYTGNSWDDIPDEMYNKYFSSNTMHYFEANGVNINTALIQFLDFSNEELDEKYYGDISIDNINANKEYLYVPYSFKRPGDFEDLSKYKFKKESSMYIEGGSAEYSFMYNPNFINLEKADIIKNKVKSIIDEKSSGSPDNLAFKDYFSKIDKYNKFVQEAYTNLPEEGLSGIKSKYSGRYNENKDVKACVKEAIDAVTADTTYDLAPGSLPKGKDFVEYFLYENKKGYCSHYASSAAVILRAMGVPTRYVEGYVIKEEDAKNAKDKFSKELKLDKLQKLNKEEAMNQVPMTEVTFDEINEDGYIIYPVTQTKNCEFKTMDIKDSSAHAWIEVYIENVGWVPVDVTPGFGDNNDVVNDTKTPEKNNTSATTSNKVETPKQEEVAPVNNPVEDIKANTIEITKTENSVMVQIIKGILTLVIVIFLVIITIILRHKIITTKRKKSYLTSDNNKNISNAYKYLMDIFEYTGIENKDNLHIKEYVKFASEKSSLFNEEELEQIVNLFFKAEFSNHDITKEEVNKVINFTNRICEETYATLTRFQKIKYTYLRNLR